MNDDTRFEDGRTVARCTVEGMGDRPRVTYVLLAETVTEEGIEGEGYTLVCVTEEQEAVMPDIARDESSALEIFASFVRNTVTPTGSFDVITEMI